jgi:hypothetical protein
MSKMYSLIFYSAQKFLRITNPTWLYPTTNEKLPQTVSLEVHYDMNYFVIELFGAKKKIPFYVASKVYSDCSDCSPVYFNTLVL